MKLVKVFFVLTLALTLSFSLFAGGRGDAHGAGGRVAITFAGTEGAGSGQSRMMFEVAETLNATGRFDVRVFVGGALPGDTDDLVTQARLGVNLVVPSDPGRLASQFNIPDLNILMAPYVLTDPSAIEKLPHTEIFQQWQAQLREHGVAFVANMFNGFRDFYTTRPVRTVADLSGLRIRGFGNDIGMGLARHLGFAQITMPAGDIYPGISQGALDGTEIQASFANGARLYEVTSYLALTRHYMLQSSFVMGQPLLDSMSAEDREFFLRTMYEASIRWSNIIYQEEQQIFDTFRQRGMTITNVDIAEFQAAMAPMFRYNELGLTPGIRETLFAQLGL